MAQCEHFRQRQSCSICSVESVYRQYRRKAIRERNLGFELTFEEFQKLIEQPCVFCGDSPRNGVVMGIDRRDNRIGYIPWNCQSSCGPCNMLRKDLSQHEFLSRVQKIANYQEELQRREIEQAVKQEIPAQSEPKRPNPKPEPERFRHLPSDARRFLEDGVVEKR